MTISRAAYRNFSATEISNRMSNTCDKSVNGSNVDCTNCTTNKCENVLSIANTSNITQLFDASAINHWSAWGPTKRSVSGGVLVNSHYTGNRDISGAFCGYNHGATAPHYHSGGSNTNSTIQSGGSQVFSCVIDIGELLYNDVSGADTVTHVFFSVWDGSTAVGYSGIALSSATDGAGASESILDFSQAGTRITVSSISATKTYTCKIWFCSSGTWDYTGTYLEYQLNELANWTHQVRIQSANHWYLNGPYNAATVDGDGTFTSGRWDVNGAQINLSTGLMDLYYLALNTYLGSSWGDTGYDHLHLNVIVESGYYNESGTWVGTTESTSPLIYDGSWNQSYITANCSGFDIWTPGTGMNTSGYGYRFILNCQTS